VVLAAGTIRFAVGSWKHILRDDIFQLLWILERPWLMFGECRSCVAVTWDSGLTIAWLKMLFDVLCL